MTALIYEIIWIRPLSLVFGTTIYAVSTIVASFIFGLAVGSWIAGRYIDRMENPLKFFAFVHLGIAFFGILLLPIFSNLPGLYLGIYKATFPNQIFFMFTQILMSMAIISLPAALMGATLPIMMKTYSKQFAKIGHDVGKLDASNSLGAMFGTLAAGFLMIPLLGIEKSIILTVLINTVIGISILAKKKYIKVRYLVAILAAILIIITVLFLQSAYDYQTLNVGMFYQRHHISDIANLNSYLEQENVLFYKDGLYSSIMVATVPAGYDVLKINGKIQCSNDTETVTGVNNLAKFPYELYEYNYGKPNNALNIGLGCGITSNWLSEKVDTTTVEIDPLVAEASKFFYPDINHTLVIDDGRNWLLRNDIKFDLITTEPSDPFQNQGSLFTREFFSLLNSRLSENGVVSQWVPVYELTLDDMHIFYNTFHDVFPYVYVYWMEETNFAQLIFVGSQKELKIKENSFYLKSQKDITIVETELNTDNRPIIEFTTALNFGNPNLYQEHIKIKLEWMTLISKKEIILDISKLPELPYGTFEVHVPD